MRTTGSDISSERVEDGTDVMLLPQPIFDPLCCHLSTLPPLKVVRGRHGLVALLVPVAPHTTPCPSQTSASQQFRVNPLNLPTAAATPMARTTRSTASSGLTTRSVYSRLNSSGLPQPHANAVPHTVTAAPPRYGSWSRQPTPGGRQGRPLRRATAARGTGQDHAGARLPAWWRRSRF